MNFETILRLGAYSSVLKGATVDFLKLSFTTAFYFYQTTQDATFVHHGYFKLDKVMHYNLLMPLILILQKSISPEPNFIELLEAKYMYCFTIVC